MNAFPPTQRTAAVRPAQVACPRGARSGSILVEFALVSVAFYLLLAGTLELGRMVTAAQVVQNAARIAARELALTPLPATTSFEDALECQNVRERVYDPALLAVDISAGLPDTDAWPTVNRMLLPLMVISTIDGTSYLHYPGALVMDPTGTRTVAVPQVVSQGTSSETIRWVPVLEEVRPEGAQPGSGPFSLSSSGPERGLVAVRINYPYQATTMISLQPGPGGSSAALVPVEANDSGVTQLNSPGGTLIGGSDGAGPYAGSYGLGKFYALSKEVRPYRRLISAQSAFRREVFGPGNCP
jgi:Flp pilus assembly protein TadG